MSALKNAFLPAAALMLALSSPVEASQHQCPAVPADCKGTFAHQVRDFVEDHAGGLGLAALAVAGFAATRKKTPSMDA